MKLNQDIICLINKIILCCTLFHLEYLLYYNKIILDPKLEPEIIS